MNAWDELALRCAAKRREKIGPLSDQAFDELLLAVRDVFDCLIVQSGQKALLHFEEGVFCLSLQRLPTQDDA